MRRAAYLLTLGVVFVFLCFAVSRGFAQNGGTGGSIQGVVTDPSGAVISGAAVDILNPVTGYTRKTTTDATGNFAFRNVPLDKYHLAVTAPGFGAITHDVNLMGSVPVSLTLTMAVSAENTTVTVN